MDKSLASQGLEMTMEEHGGDCEVKKGRKGYFWNPMGFFQDLKFLGSLQRRKGHSNEYLSQTHRDRSYSHYPDFSIVLRCSSFLAYIALAMEII